MILNRLSVERILLGTVNNYLEVISTNDGYIFAITAVIKTQNSWSYADWNIDIT